MKYSLWRAVSRADRRNAPTNSGERENRIRRLPAGQRCRPLMKAKNGSGKGNRRKEILQAAEKLMVTRGLSGITTRQISEEAGCSEGALYVHFKGRLELLLAMLEETLPEMLGPLRALQQQVGRRSPQANLATALRGIFRFHQR